MKTINKMNLHELCEIEKSCITLERYMAREYIGNVLYNPDKKIKDIILALYFFYPND